MCDGSSERPQQIGGGERRGDYLDEGGKEAKGKAP